MISREEIKKFEQSRLDYKDRVSKPGRATMGE